MTRFTISQKDSVSNNFPRERCQGPGVTHKKVLVKYLSIYVTELLDHVIREHYTASIRWVQSYQAENSRLRRDPDPSWPHSVPLRRRLFSGSVQSRCSSSDRAASLVLSFAPVISLSFVSRPQVADAHQSRIWIKALKRPSRPSDDLPFRPWLNEPQKTIGTRPCPTA